MQRALKYSLSAAILGLILSHAGFAQTPNPQVEDFAEDLIRAKSPQERSAHQLLSNHIRATAQGQGWGGLKNGDLLRRAETEFDLFITSDQNIRYHRTSREPASRFSNSLLMILLASVRLRCSFKPPLRVFVR